MYRAKPDAFSQSISFWLTVLTSLFLLLVTVAFAGFLLFVGRNDAATTTLLIALALTLTAPVTILSTVNYFNFINQADARLFGRYSWTVIVWRYFFFINLVIAIPVFYFRKEIAASIRSLAQRPFIADNHFILFFIVALIIVGLGLRYAIAREQFSWELLERLQAISIFSPLYCLGGGLFSSKAIETLGIAKRNADILTIAFVLCGVLFLFFLLFFVLLRPAKEKEGETKSKDAASDIIVSESVPLLVDIYNNPIKSLPAEKPDQNNSSLTLYVPTFVAGLAIALLISTVLDFSFIIVSK